MGHLAHKGRILNFFLILKEKQLTCNLNIQSNDKTFLNTLQEKLSSNPQKKISTSQIFSVSLSSYNSSFTYLG